MILELLFLLLLVSAVCVIAYRGAVHEFQILQKTYGEDTTNWSSLLSEQLPLVIRNVPKSWLGGWTAAKNQNKTWAITVENAQGKQFRTTWATWLQTGQNIRPLTMEDIAENLHLEKVSTAMSSDEVRRWSMLPHARPIPAVFHPDIVQPLKKGVAEFTVITVTDGEPLEIWLAHEGALPAATANALQGRDPWTSTGATVPYISEVKYVEIRLRPGNTLAIPKHWYYALRNKSEKEQTWFHTIYFQTPVSYAIHMLKK